MSGALNGSALARVTDPATDKRSDWLGVTSKGKRRLTGGRSNQRNNDAKVVTVWQSTSGQIPIYKDELQMSSFIARGGVCFFGEDGIVHRQSVPSDGVRIRVGERPRPGSVPEPDQLIHTGCVLYVVLESVGQLRLPEEREHGVVEQVLTDVGQLVQEFLAWQCFAADSRVEQDRRTAH